MLHGHAKIELTNVHTGKKEVIEKDNIVTNAMKDILSRWGILSGGGVCNTAYLPVINKAMGGLLLFDNTIDANANNYFYPNPAVAALTGYAGNVTSDGNDTKRGDYNFSESGAISNGYKFVWDFGTDDANGEIAALALTHAATGYHGYNVDYEIIRNDTNGTSNVPNSGQYKGMGVSSGMNIYFSLDTFGKLVSINDDGEIVGIDDRTAGKIVVKKNKIITTNLMLNDTLNMYKLIDSHTIDINDSNFETNSYCWADGEDGYYYGIRNVNHGIRICKINKSTYEYTAVSQYNFDNTNENVGTVSSISGSGTTWRYGYMYPAVIRSGYIYTINNTDKLIKIPLNNPTETTEVSSVSASGHAVSKLPNGVITTNNLWVDSNDATYAKAARNYTTQQYLYSKTMMIFCGATSGGGSGEQYLCPNPLYLATINNLDGAIEKTAAKTMKITYILTETA